MVWLFCVCVSEFEKETRDSLMAPHSRVVDPLLQRPLEVRKALCAAAEAHLLAEVVPPPATDGALPARHADLEGHAVAEREAPHAGADGHHHARGLVAERQGLAGAEVAVGELLEVGHVRAADARRVDGDLEGAVCWWINGPSFLGEWEKRSVSQCKM